MSEPISSSSAPELYAASFDQLVDFAQTEDGKKFMDGASYTVLGPHTFTVVSYGSADGSAAVNSEYLREKTEQRTDADGKPVVDADGNPVMVVVDTFNETVARAFLCRLDTRNDITAAAAIAALKSVASSVGAPRSYS